MMRIEVKNRIDAGDRLEVLTPGGVRAFTAERIIREDTGEEVRAVTVAGLRVMIPSPFAAEAGDYLRR